AMLPYTQILYEPGSKYHYSNPAIIFLGQIIKQLSGDAYELYIDKNILKPLKMYHTYYDITPYHLLKYRSNSYRMAEEGPKPLGLDFNTGITASNGGLNAPLADMTKYLAFLSGAAPNKAVLKRSSLEEMWKIQQSVGQNDGVKTSMGLSFFIE